MRKTSLFAISARILFLVIMMTCLVGCGRNKVNVRGAEGEKFVEVMIGRDSVEQRGVQATITHLETKKVYTADYAEEIQSFCFIVEEEGMYEVSVAYDADQTLTRFLNVDKENSYYVVFLSVE